MFVALIVYFLLMEVGKALGVLGWLDTEELGRTLCHEHLLIDAEALHVPAEPHHLEESCKPVSDLSNLHWLRYFPYSSKANLHVEEVPVLEKELLAFKKVGGATLVDVTITGLRPQHLVEGHAYGECVAELSRRTGVNIIVGTGFYVDHVHPDFITEASIEDIAAFMVNELTEGITSSKGVRAGVIGEIGCSWPLTENEKKVLQASALVQQRTGAPLIIHPGRDEAAPMQIVHILQESGADITHTVMSHLDRTIFTDAKWYELAATGIFLELDLFGTECSYYQQNKNVYMPHDGQRIERVIDLVQKGFVRQVLLSHDIHTNHRLISFGGHGYSHIFDRIIPRLLHLGLTQEDVDTITIANPSRWLAFRHPRV